MGFEFLTAVKMLMLFCIVMPCRLASRYNCLPEDNGRSICPQNTGIRPQAKMASQPRRWTSILFIDIPVWISHAICNQRME